MDKECRQAFTEVYEILELMPKELINKIPNKFYEMIKQERDKSYNPIIKEPIENQELKKETVVILGLIYRDFICDENEREELKKQDAIALYEEQKAIEEIKKTYNADDLFKHGKENKIVPKKVAEEKSLLIVEKEIWYKKILGIIKRFFR